MESPNIADGIMPGAVPDRFGRNHGPPSALPPTPGWEGSPTRRPLLPTKHEARRGKASLAPWCEVRTLPSLRFDKSSVPWKGSGPCLS